MAAIGTPIPNSSKETSARGAGPVVSYQLSPEEQERYRSMPATPRDGNGKTRKRPVAAHHELDPEEQRRRAKMRYESEDNEVGNQPSKHEYLRLRAAGKTHAEIESILQLSKGVISSYWLGKWDLKGITREKAAEMIAERESLPAEPVLDSGPVQEEPPAPDALDDQNALIENLRAANANYVAMAGEAAAMYQAEIDELRNDRDEWRQTATELKDKVNFQTTHIAGQEERIRHLEEDLDLVREPVRVIIVEEAPPPAGFITLRFPLIDTGDRDIAGRLKSLEMIGDIKGKPLDITGIDLPRLARDGLEVMQVIVGVVHAVTADIVELEDLERTLQQFFFRHNEDHTRQIRFLAEEHAWEIKV